MKKNTGQSLKEFWIYLSANFLLKKAKTIREKEIMDRYVWLLSVTVGQKEGLRKKLITTWEGRELVTWLFLKIYHPLSSHHPKTTNERKI